MMKNQYYLAHPFYSRKRIRNWELEIENKKSIDLINPFYDVERKDVQDIDQGVENPYVKPYKEIVEDDLELIESSIGVVAIVDKGAAVGIYQELVYAHNWEKDIHSIVLNGKEGHPWLKYHSNEIYNSLEDFESSFIDQF